jgi:hypothetical protein
LNEARDVKSCGASNYQNSFKEKVEVNVFSFDIFDLFLAFEVC